MIPGRLGKTWAGGDLEVVDRLCLCMVVNKDVAGSWLAPWHGLMTSSKGLCDPWEVELPASRTEVQVVPLWNKWRQETRQGLPTPISSPPVWIQAPTKGQAPLAPVT